MTPHPLPAPFEDLTFRKARIAKWFGARAEALAWAATDGDRWPGSRIVQNTTRGPRTIWREADPKPTETERAAA